MVGILVLMAVLLVVEIVTSDLQSSLTQAIEDRLIPERDEVDRLRGTITAADDEGAWYLLSRARDPASLQRYRSDVRRVHVGLLALEQRTRGTAEHQALLLLRTTWAHYEAGNERAFAIAWHGDAARAQAAFLHVPLGPTMLALTVLDVQIAREIETRLRDRMHARTTERVVGVVFGLAMIALAAIVALRLRGSLATRMRFLRDHDESTGLPNARFALAYLDRQIRAKPRGVSSIAIVRLRLHGLKTIDDSIGNGAGDAVVLLAAERLKRMLPPNHLLARATREEFIVLLEDASTREHAEYIVRAAMAELREPFVVAGRELVVRVRAGLSLYADDALDAAELLRNAGAALDAANAARPPWYVWFTPPMREHSIARLELERDLQRALASREFDLYYQPIVDVTSDRVEGFEGLLRWHHPSQGTLRPDAFLDVAEQSASIEELGSWVLRTACEQCKMWRDTGSDVAVSVNISPEYLRACDLVTTVRTVLADVGLEPSALQLELTESGIADEGARVALSTLGEDGVRIAIDDFGTGYSSLSYLRHFPANTVKIDRSFVSDIERRPYDRAIVSAIVRLAQSLHMDVVAEGVENAAQAQALRALGCTQMQGYHFGPAVPASQCVDMLKPGAR